MRTVRKGAVGLSNWRSQVWSLVQTKGLQKVTELSEEEFRRLMSDKYCRQVGWYSRLFVSVWPIGDRSYYGLIRTRQKGQHDGKLDCRHFDSLDGEDVDRSSGPGAVKKFTKGVRSGPDEKMSRIFSKGVFKHERTTSITDALSVWYKSSSIGSRSFTNLFLKAAVSFCNLRKKDMALELNDN
ncbi:hypothetical protein L218DRAFT_949519 [Marasmius fiardii PR-910]|nr:hypothetical protein L218DRAFT_949519 [Marasmius fiardii PR-910]